MLKRKISFVTYNIIITVLILVVGISCLLVIQNNLIMVYMIFFGFM